MECRAGACVAAIGFPERASCAQLCRSFGASCTQRHWTRAYDGRTGFRTVIPGTASACVIYSDGGGWYPEVGDCAWIPAARVGHYTPGLMNCACTSG